MRIRRISTWIEHFELSRPYTIAFRTVDSVRNGIVRIETDDSSVGLGCASPERFVTGETWETCDASLAEPGLRWLVGRNVHELTALCRELRERFPGAPAARAAVDIALHDLWAKQLGVPLADALGRAHAALPTSITIGIKDAGATVQEASEYLQRGFKVLKVKLGHSLDDDLERLQRLRDFTGEAIVIRVDPNQGYSADEVTRFIEATAGLDIEFLEQPMKADDIDAMRALPDAVKDRLAADETLLDDSDALALAQPPRACGIFNIKLMKCGGVHTAKRIASIAETAGIELMWGCMDESVVSISAALHAAFSSPATRYLDLDGSLDLARDVAEGGFILEDGVMRTLHKPGLGVTLRS